MTPAAFYSAMLSLWGEDWRPELTRFLSGHGLTYSRQSFWNWRKGVYPIPGMVAKLVEAELARRGRP